MNKTGKISSYLAFEDRASHVRKRPILFNLHQQDNPKSQEYMGILEFLLSFLSYSFSTRIHDIDHFDIYLIVQFFSLSPFEFTFLFAYFQKNETGFIKLSFSPNFIQIKTSNYNIWIRLQCLDNLFSFLFGRKGMHSFFSFSPLYNRFMCLLIKPDRLLHIPTVFFFFFF